MKPTTDLFRFTLLCAAVLLTPALVGCGQTGPLYMPTKPVTKPAAKTEPAAPAAATGAASSASGAASSPAAK